MADMANVEVKVVNIVTTSTDRRFASLRVWWHCLRLTFADGHQWITMRANGTYRRHDFCRCGYNGDGPASPRKASLG